MGQAALTREQAQETVDVYRASGLNVSETARRLGLTRQPVRLRLQHAYEMGLLNLEEKNPANGPLTEEYTTLRAQKLKVFQRKKAKGTWRKPVLVHLPPGPFRLKVLGDPHLDAAGCNFELFEKHWLEMNPAKGCFGVCVGDWFNNWIGSLSHLFSNEPPVSEAYPLLQYLMENHGEGLIAACSGNHDDWLRSAPWDPIDDLMKRHGVRYRMGAIRLAIKCGDADPVTVALRHKWRGNSIYSAAHGIRRHVEKGWRDTIAIGGHIHQDEPRMYTCPETGEHTHICQVSAFKEFDEHVDTQGYQGPRISPAWDLVIDPDAPDDDPDKVKTFWQPHRAQAYLEAIA